MSDLEYRESDTQDIQIRALMLLTEVCGLTYAEVQSILDRTGIITVIRGMYEILHQEGEWAMMRDIQRALSNRGVAIEVPELDDVRWKRWNHIVQ